MRKSYSKPNVAEPAVADIPSAALAHLHNRAGIFLPYCSDYSSLQAELGHIRVDARAGSILGGWSGMQNLGLWGRSVPCADAQLWLAIHQTEVGAVVVAAAMNAWAAVLG